MSDGSTKTSQKWSICLGDSEKSSVGRIYVASPILNWENGSESSIPGYIVEVLSNTSTVSAKFLFCPRTSVKSKYKHEIIPEIDDIARNYTCDSSQLDLNCDEIISEIDDMARNYTCDSSQSDLNCIEVDPSNISMILDKPAVIAMIYCMISLLLIRGLIV